MPPCAGTHLEANHSAKLGHVATIRVGPLYAFFLQPAVEEAPPRAMPRPAAAPTTAASHAGAGRASLVGAGVASASSGGDASHRPRLPRGQYRRLVMEVRHAASHAIAAFLPLPQVNYACPPFALHPTQLWASEYSRIGFFTVNGCVARLRERFPEADFASKDAVVRTSVLATLKKADSGFVQVAPSDVPAEVVRAQGMSAKEERLAVWFRLGSDAAGDGGGHAGAAAGRGSSAADGAGAGASRPAGDDDGDIVMVDSGNADDDGEVDGEDGGSDDHGGDGDL